MKIFLSGSGLPVSAALLVPGVSPMRSTLATETGANNPGLRLYKYDVGSGQVGLLSARSAPHLHGDDCDCAAQILDYDQFYLNLTDVIAGGRPEWRRAYSMLEHFGLDSLSVASLAQHVQKVTIITYSFGAN